MDRRLFLQATGAVFLVAPLVAEAQSAGTVRTVGVLGHTSAKSFEASLSELGWVEGKTVRFERRASTDDGILARYAAELSRIPVDVIFAGNAPATSAAMKHTRNIPIITVSADPVRSGFVASLAHPGGNVTGIAMMHTELSGKRLAVLSEALPAARRIAFLVNPTNPSSSAVRAETEARARALRVQLLPFELSRPERAAAVLDRMAQQHPGALLVATDPLFVVIRKDLVSFVVRHSLPAMWEYRGFVQEGGLMSYGVDPDDLYRRAATYADRILKGARPADLPLEQPTKFELVINAKAAKALGLTIPQAVLLQADQVIE